MKPAAQPIAYVHFEPDQVFPVSIGRDVNWTRTNAYRPHRHAYHEIMWFQEGTGTHQIDNHTISIEPHTVALIAQGQVHCFLESINLTSYVICFTDDFFGNDLSYHTLFQDLPPERTLRIPPAERAHGDMLLQLIESEYHKQSQIQGHYAMLRHLLRAFLAQIERIYRTSEQGHSQAVSEHEQLYRAFLHLLDQHIYEEHRVAFYAQALNRSVEQLSGAMRQMFGKTAKQLIVERLILEARRRLQFTHYSIKEVAFALGFSDPFHFSKLFKQQVGRAPQEYREYIQGHG